MYSMYVCNEVCSLAVVVDVATTVWHTQLSRRLTVFSGCRHALKKQSLHPLTATYCHNPSIQYG